MKSLTPEQQQLVTANMEFAKSLALTFVNRGVDLEDLQQESLYGLCVAATHYDPQLNNEFAAFAYFWCRKMMYCALRNYANPGGITCDKDYESKILSLDISFGPESSTYHDEHDDGGNIQDRYLFKAYEETNSENQLFDFQAELTTHLLGKLKKIQRQVITLLFGLEGITFTPAQIAELLNVRVSRIYQIRDEALAKMRG